VVEEIVGEIEDEHDEEMPGMLIPLEDGIWDADARTELEEVAETVDARLGIVEEDVDTLGGLAVVLAGHVPQLGEIVEHRAAGGLEVTDSDPRRVNRLRLHAPPKALSRVGHATQLPLAGCGAVPRGCGESAKLEVRRVGPDPRSRRR
jgi:CBS domain containing-hemolysin-like protein